MKWKIIQPCLKPSRKKHQLSPRHVPALVRPWITCADTSAESLQISGSFDGKSSTMDRESLACVWPLLPVIRNRSQWKIYKKNTDIYIYMWYYIYTLYILYTLEWFWNYCSGYFSWDPQVRSSETPEWPRFTAPSSRSCLLAKSDVAKLFGHIFGYIFTRHTTVDGCEIVPYCTHMPCNIGKHTEFLPPLKQLVAKSYINVVSTVVNIPWFTGFQHVSTIRLVQDFAGPSGGHRAQLK